jgi:hypothetical protein
LQLGTGANNVALVSLSSPKFPFNKKKGFKETSGQPKS